MTVCDGRGEEREHGGDFVGGDVHGFDKAAEVADPGGGLGGVGELSEFVGGVRDEGKVVEDAVQNSESRDRWVG